MGEAHLDDPLADAFYQIIIRIKRLEEKVKVLEGGK